jgi:hypothetical protein
VAVLSSHADRPTEGSSHKRLVGTSVGIVLLSAVALYIVLGVHLSFFNDDWYFLLQRPGLESSTGLDVLLAPHNSNMVVVPTAIYKLVADVFGLSSQAPFRAVLGLLIATAGLLVYVLVSRRAGWAWGIAAAAVLVFLGPAWEDLLFFASIDLIGSLVAGLGALIALERDTRRRAVLACLLLVVAVAFSNLGVAFAAGAAVCVVVRRRPDQLWVALIPLIVFAAWWAGYGRDEPSHLSASNIMHLPAYLFDSAATGFASLTGLSAGSDPASYVRGKIVLAAVFALAIVWLAAGHRPTRFLLVPVTTLLVFWVLTGISFFPGREPFASRYQLIDVALIIVVIAEFFRPASRTLGWSVLALALAVAIIISNTVGQLSQGFRFLEDQATYVKTDLGILQAMRNHVPADLRLTDEVAQNPYLSGITGSRYIAVTQAHRTPPFYSPDQILRAPSQQRHSADGVLAALEQLRGTRAISDLPADCTSVGNQPGDASKEIALGDGTTFLRNTTSTGLGFGVRRFAPAGLLTGISLIRPGETERVKVPRDNLPLRWYLQPMGGSPMAGATLRVCS